MQQGDVGLVLRDLFMVVLKLGAPGLVTAMAVGLVISLIQAVTQINETTLAFVPKVLALGAALMLAGPREHKFVKHAVTECGRNRHMA